MTSSATILNDILSLLLGNILSLLLLIGFIGWPVFALLIGRWWLRMLTDGAAAAAATPVTGQGKTDQTRDRLYDQDLDAPPLLQSRSLP